MKDKGTQCLGGGLGMQMPCYLDEELMLMG